MAGGLTEAVVAHHLFPSKYPAPEALILHFDLGENRMIVAGGVKDQPAGEWTAAKHAGYIWYVLDTAASATAQTPVSSLLKARDLIVWQGDPDKPGDKGLLGIRQKIQAKHAEDSDHT